MSSYRPWQLADEGEVNGRVFDYVAEVERAQFDEFDRFEKMAALYDPPTASSEDGKGKSAQMTENVVASNIDTVTSVIASTEVRPRFLTDDGDWSTQRTARHLGWYAEGLAKKLNVHAACAKGFKAGGLKGTGLNKVYIDEFDRIRVEPTLVDDIVVDESEARFGEPRQMHHRRIVDCDALAAKFPEFRDEIESSVKRGAGGMRKWAGYRPIERDELVCIESWYLPIGDDREHKKYRAGRHTIVIDGKDLLDEEYHKPHFPFAVFRWTEKTTGWYGIGGAYRIAGHQRTLNKRNWQIDRQHDQLAVPTTYVRMADANLSVKTRGPQGTVVVYKDEIPKTIIPPAVSGETYQSRNDLKASAFEEFGQSRMAAQSAKPAGLDSGVALREYRDQTTQRFATQEKGFEQFFLDTIWLVIDCAKDLGADAPAVVKKSHHGPKKITWSKVDMGEVKVQLVAASSLSRTPAGRLQMVMEAAQAGIISTDSARRMMMPHSPLDFEQELSLYTAAVECLERAFEAILDGEEGIAPEPYSNLKLAVWRGQASLLKAEDDGAPEDVLENFRQYVVQAAWMASEGQEPAAQPYGPAAEDPMAMPPEGMPMDPAMAGMPGAMPPGMPPGDPYAPPPNLMGARVSPVDFLQ